MKGIAVGALGFFMAAHASRVAGPAPDWVMWLFGTVAVVSFIASRSEAAR